MTELFVLGTPTDDRGIAAALSGSTDAGIRAVSRRGIDLNAHAEAQAAFSAQLDSKASVALNAGIRAGGEAAFRAALPVDLFDVAGVVAQAGVGVFASAFVRLDTSLSASAFADELVARLPEPLNGAPGVPDSVAGPLKAFLDH